jgi:hypothetical protein
MPYDQFAKQRIFEPLGMKDTFFYPTDGNPRIVTLYQRGDGAFKKQTNPGFMNGAYFSGGGGLFTTAEDLSAIRADAAQRRAVEREAAPGSADDRADVDGFRAGYTAGSPGRGRVRPECARGERVPRVAIRISRRAASAGAARTTRISGSTRGEKIVAVMMTQGCRSLRPRRGPQRLRDGRDAGTGRERRHGRDELI